MKKLVVLFFTLLCSKVALADGGIPLLMFIGSNIFISGTIVPPFIFGLFLFWIVYSIERWYLVKKLNLKEDITKPVILANICSTLWGIPLSIGLFFIQNQLCKVFPYKSSADGELVCLLAGPFHISPIIDLILLGVMSWFVEYRYLMKQLNYPKLKKALAFANLYSYIAMTICSVLIFRFVIWLIVDFMHHW